MKNPKRGATKRIAYGGAVLIFIVGMAALAASTFGVSNSQKAQTKSFDEKRVTTDDRATLTTTPGSGPCDPHFTACGRVKIVKNTVPDNYQDFYFLTNIPGYGTQNTLDDDPTLTNPSSVSNTKTFYTPADGNFYVAEPVTEGFTTSLSCADPSSGTTISGGTANISMSGGETVVCTFNNLWTGLASCPSNTWVQKADFPQEDLPGTDGRGDATGFGISPLGKGYLGFGIHYDFYSDLWEYNPLINVWTQKATNLWTPRAGAVGLSIGVKGYVIGGYYSSGALPSYGNWEYNPATDVWTQKADYPGSTPQHMSGFSIGNKGYVVMGQNLYQNYGAYSNDVWEYTPATNTWVQKADFGGVARGYAAGFSIGNKGYIGTGYYLDNWGATLADFWEYNPATDSWTQKADFAGGARREAVGFSAGGKGYIGTGASANLNQLFSDFWEYNPATDSWTQKANFGGGIRRAAVGISIGNKGYIGTGSGTLVGSNTSKKDWWQYCP